MIQRENQKFQVTPVGNMPSGQIWTGETWWNVAYVEDK